MTFPFRRTLFARLPASVTVVVTCLAGAATAQTGAQAPPAMLTVMMETRNGQVTCGPQRTTVEAGSILHLHVTNRTELPLWFVAPQFLAAADHLESVGFTLEAAQGGFSVAPEASATAVLRTPSPGEYYFSCFEPGAVPNPRSSGFIEVVAARR